MKTDLITSIIATIVGIVVAFLVTNLLTPAIADVSFKTLSADPAYTLTDPDPEVFNYKALDPTVEVYVGQCSSYNEAGECIENVTTIENPDQNAITDATGNGTNDGSDSASSSTDNSTSGGGSDNASSY